MLNGLTDLKTPAKVFHNQTVLPLTYPYQLPLGKVPRCRWDFIPYCAAKSSEVSNVCILWVQ